MQVKSSHFLSKVFPINSYGLATVGFMDEKKKWNVGVYASVADVFDADLEGEFHGAKGVAVTAALLAWLRQPLEVRQAWMRHVRNSEVELKRTTMLEAAQAKADKDPLITGKIGDGQPPLKLTDHDKPKEQTFEPGGAPPTISESDRAAARDEGKKGASPPKHNRTKKPE